MKLELPTGPTWCVTAVCPHCDSSVMRVIPLVERAAHAALGESRGGV